MHLNMCRKAIDMAPGLTPLSVWFLRLERDQYGGHNQSTSVYMRRQGSKVNSSLSIPIISDQSFGNEGPSSILPGKSSSSSHSKLSINELAASSHQRSSLAQSVINGRKTYHL